MLVYDVEFAITDGLVVSAIRDGLTANGWADGLTVQRKRPDTMTRRVVTVRNDGGPTTGITGVRRYGINVWADDPVDAENIALGAQRRLRSTLPGSGPITRASGFTLPFEVDDDPPYVVGGVNLSHYYFAFDARLRGVAA